MEILGYGTWADKYKPKFNQFKTGELMFETYDEELKYVQSVDPKYIWTYVTGDECDLLVAGYSYVNRLGYYITENPWEDEDDYVLISVEKECECYNEDGYPITYTMPDGSTRDSYTDGKPDCTICEGNGMYTEWVG
jgi:hypothetical protein